MARLEDMTKGRPLSLMLRFALPMMIGNAFQLLYSIADGAVVGRLIGVSAFAAIGATGFAYWLLFHTVLGLSHGFGALLAQRFGSGDAGAFRRAAGTASALMALFGLALSAAGALLARPLMRMQGTPSDILDGAALYMAIMGGGMILTAMYNLAATLLRSIGDSRTPLWAMIWSTLINIALDVVLVPATGWGVGCVAATTLVAQAFALGYCLRALLRSPELLPGRADLRIDRQDAARLLRLGAPCALSNAVVSMGGLVVQSVVNGFGTAFVAGVALPSKLYGMMEVIGGALEGSAAVYVAQNCGAKRTDRILAGVRTARWLMLASAALVGGLLLVLGGPLMAMMVGAQGTETVLRIAREQLWVMLAGLPFLYLLVLYRAAVQSMGDAIVPMLSGFAELGTRLLCALALTRVWGEWGAYLAVSAGWPVGTVVVMVAYARMVRQNAPLAEVDGM